MKVTEVKKGMRFILNTGTQVEFLGNGVFGDIKTGEKYLEKDLPGEIQYGYKSNEELVDNSGDEEPLDTPTMFSPTDNSLEVTDKEEFQSGGVEIPLDTPSMNFSGQAEVREKTSDEEALV